MSKDYSMELVGWATTKPIRVAFLVEQSKHSALVLDGIFADCYSRWGGRFSLIVPCLNGRVCEQYWSWLEIFDPDVIYSYVNLPAEGVLEIHERLAGAEYIYGCMSEPLRLDVYGFKPALKFAPLSSLSTIFRLGRHSPRSVGPKLKIIDSWPTESPSRFLSDNFGTYQQSTGTRIYPNDARATAGLLTIVSDQYWTNRQCGVPQDLDRVASERDALVAFVDLETTSVSMLSALYAPRLEMRDNTWSTAFNLVVGDTFEDRLLHWNARLLIPTWLDGDLCCLRITLDQFEDEAFVQLLAKLLNSRNHVTSGSSQPHLAIRSASHSAQQLQVVLDKLHAARVWSVSGPVQVIAGGHVIPDTEALEHAQEAAGLVDARFRIPQRNAFRWSPPVARPPVLEPEHLDDAPAGQTFTLGLWRLDLGFEYDTEGARFGRRNIWVLPKRWRMGKAFESDFADLAFGQSLAPPHRTSRDGSLLVCAGRDRLLETVTIPTLFDALQRAFCWDAQTRFAFREDPSLPQKGINWMRPSNENHHLVGVLGLAGGLVNAKLVLLHPFLQEVFASLGGTPNLADADIQATTNKLMKRGKGKPSFDLSSDDERKTLAALVVKAAQSIKAPKMHVALADLQERWKAYRDAFWNEHPDKISQTEEERIEWDRREQRAIDNVLGVMRKRRLLFQGYPWTCDECQHKNWTDFHALKSSLACVICNAETELPVSIPWHFRPNDFVVESLRSHSVLSLVWVLSALRERARSSFMYVGPTCFGLSNNYDKADAEGDLLAVVDGVSFLCEVKSSWRSLRATDLDGLVNLAKRLRPDQVILAVMEDGGSRFDERIRTASSALAAEGITFELLTTSRYCVEDDPHLIAG